MGWLVNRVTITFSVIAIVVIAWNLYVAANDDGILAGMVVDPEGNAVPGAEVTLSERTIVSLEPIATTTSDDQGRFRFEDHDRHRMVLTAAKDGVGESGRREVQLYFKNQNRELEEPLLLSP
ncbi:MAG: carboxypeptidase-like regulatory domain-containing protein [Pseudomonadota bacterium]